MNSFPHDCESLQRRLDLLVDGELSEVDRRTLIVLLEEQPDGWRQCALAFLEAQSWRDDLRAVAHPPAGLSVTASNPTQPAATARAAGSRTNWWRAPGLGSLLALAASVLLVFGVGLGAGRWLPGRMGGPSGSPISVETTLASNISGGHAAAATGRQRSGSEAANVDHVTVLLAEGNDTVVPVQVPVVGNAGSAAGWLNSMPPLPPDVRRALERHGGRVREHRQLIPVRLGDGRQVVVPVDRIDLQPVNLKDYQ